MHEMFEGESSSEEFQGLGPFCVNPSSWKAVGSQSEGRGTRRISCVSCTRQST